MNIPENLKYTEDHEWIRIEDDFAYVGITDFAQSELGDLVYVEIDFPLDETIEKGEVFGTIEAVKTTAELYMPLTAKIVEFNKELDENIGDNPALINNDPYEEGWIVKIEIEDISQIDDLLDAKAYAELIN